MRRMGFCMVFRVFLGPRIFSGRGMGDKQLQAKADSRPERLEVVETECVEIRKADDKLQTTATKCQGSRNLGLALVVFRLAQRQSVAPAAVSCHHSSSRRDQDAFTITSIALHVLSCPEALKWPESTALHVLRVSSITKCHLSSSNQHVTGFSTLALATPRTISKDDHL